MLLDVEVDDDQCLLVAGWRQLRYGRVLGEGLVVSDDTPDEVLGAVRVWAVEHPSKARFVRDAGELSIDRLSTWAEEVLRPAVTGKAARDGRVHGRAWLATWGAAWVMSRLARYWGEGEGDNFGGWSLGLFDPPSRCDDLPGAGLPRLQVRQLSEDITLVNWGGLPPSNGQKVRGRMPPVIDLRHLCRPTGGDGLDSVKVACAAFEISAPVERGEDTLSARLDALARRLDALDQLTRAALAGCDSLERRRPTGRRTSRGRLELAPTGIPADPRVLYSGGSVATSLLRTIGLRPCSERVVHPAERPNHEDEELHRRVVGAFAGAGYGGRIEGNLVGKWFPAAHLDLSGAYTWAAEHTGISDLILAECWLAREVTGEVRTWLGQLAEADDPVAVLVRPDALWRMPVVVLVKRLDGATLPYRKLLASGDVTSAVGLLSLREPDTVPPYLVDDLAGAVLRDNDVRFEVVQAWRVEPHGRITDLSSVILPGEVCFDPSDPDANLYTSLRASRRAVGEDQESTPATRERRVAEVKGLSVSAAFGVFARVDRKRLPERVERRKEVPRTKTVIGSDGELIESEVENVIEEPGPDHSPVLWATVTAATRLAGAIVERRVRESGGVVAQTLTDAYTIPVSPRGGVVRGLGCRGLSPRQVREIIDELHERFDLTLKIEHDSLDRPVDAFVAGRNRYVFERDGETVHASEFGVGGVHLDPSGSGDARLSDGSRRWVRDGLAWAVGEDDDDPAQRPEWLDCWTVSPFRAASPKLAGWLGGDTRPFDQAVAVHLDPVATMGDRDAKAGPVARALWTTPPEDWPGLAWQHRSGQPARPAPSGLLPGSVLASDRFVPHAIAWALQRWAACGAIHGNIERPGAVVVGEPVPLGREGEWLVERQKGIATPAEAITFYGRTDRAWKAAVAALRRMSPAEMAESLPEVPQRTRRRVRSTGAASRRHRAEIVEALRHLGIARLADAGRQVPSEAGAVVTAASELVPSEEQLRELVLAARRNVGPKRFAATTGVALDTAKRWPSRRPKVREVIATIAAHRPGADPLAVLRELAAEAQPDKRDGVILGLFAGLHGVARYRPLESSGVWTDRAEARPRRLIDRTTDLDEVESP